MSTPSQPSPSPGPSSTATASNTGSSQSGFSPLASRLHELVAACFTGLWIETHEADEAVRELTQLCHHESWRIAYWNCDSGLSFPCSDSPMPVNPDELQDPLAVIRSAGQVSSGSETTLIVLENLHRYLGNIEIIQALSRHILTGKHTRTFFVIVAPSVNLPAELEKQVIVIEHELPDRDQLREIATSIAQEDELPVDDQLQHVLDSAAGLTRYEAEGAFSLSIVRHGRLVPSAIWDVKGQQLKKAASCHCIEAKKDSTPWEDWPTSRRFVDEQCGHEEPKQQVIGLVVCSYFRLQGAGRASSPKPSAMKRAGRR
jgi:hypothetical protein